MKRQLAGLVSACCVFPLLAVAQEAPDFSSVEVTLGIQQRAWDSDPDTVPSSAAGPALAHVDSSKFLEYRDLPQGGVVPALRFRGKQNDFRWDVIGRDVAQKDQTYFVSLSKAAVRLDGAYVGIPHNFGFGGRSILNPTTPNSWQMSDTLQRAFQTALEATLPGRSIDYDCRPRPGFVPRAGCLSLLGLVSPTLDAQPPGVDLKLSRGRTSLVLSLTPRERPLDVSLSYQHEKRSGYRAVNGTAFGFGNVVETPEPLRYVTQDVALRAAYSGAWGSAHAAVRWNDFRNRYEFFHFDNPFRGSDSSDPSAYQAPGAQSINGAAMGQMALPPDNRAVTESLGVALKLGSRTRLSADGTLGQWSQDRDPFAAWTTNTAIVLPDGRSGASVPSFARTLGGAIDTTALNLFLHTTIAKDLGVNARYRRYDLQNDTPRYPLSEGYARFDAVWEEIPRVNVPYGYANDVFDGFLTYGLGLLGVEAGYRHSRAERTFRDTEDTREDVVRLAVDVRRGWLAARAIGEVGWRDSDHYELERSEHASFLAPGLPANQTVLRRPDQARRDLSRIGAQLEISPSERLGLAAQYLHTRFDYDEDPVECQQVAAFAGQSQYCPGGEQAPLGLMRDGYDSLSVDANYRPSERLGLYAFYSYEDGDVLQTGRQSAATLNFNPADVWTVDMTNRGHTFGAGAELTIVPARWSAGVMARYQKVDGFNDISLRQGFSTAVYGTNPVLLQCANEGASPCDIAALDDTKWASVYGLLRYQLAKQWSASLGLGWEHYEIRDDQTDSQLNYLPGSFFLQANNRGYDGVVGHVNVTYALE